MPFFLGKLTPSFTWRNVDKSPAAFGHFHLEGCQVFDLDLVLLAQVSGQVGGRGFDPGVAERTDVEGVCGVLDELGQFEAGAVVGVLVLVDDKVDGALVVLEVQVRLALEGGAFQAPEGFHPRVGAVQVGVELVQCLELKKGNSQLQQRLPSPKEW